MANENGASPKKKQEKLGASELSIFCTQISLFLRSGITIAEGLNLLEEDLENPNLSRVIAQVNKAVQERELFHVALERAGAFPDYFVRMVSIGEVSGNLDNMLVALTKYYEREQALKYRIRSAVTYPITLLVMMSLIVLLLIVKILPMFEDILRSLGGEMPAVVKGIMAFGNFLGNYWLIILVLLLVIVIAFRLLGRTESGQNFYDRLKISTPGVRGIYERISAERFATAMSFLLQASINVDDSLDMSKDILGNAYMRGKINECIQLTAQGKELSEALYEAGCFPKLFTKMLGIAQKTGELDDMMFRLAGIYEQEVDAALKRVTSVIEPAFVVVLSIIVGVILISVMLPLISIMSSIG